MEIKAIPVERRFLRYFTPTDGCWLWEGAQSSNGYGKIGLSASEGSTYAHRIAWKVYKGAIPDGLFVLHHCDIRLCVNPEHLFLGTHIDNLADMRTKGRWHRTNPTKRDTVTGRFTYGILDGN